MLNVALTTTPYPPQPHTHTQTHTRTDTRKTWTERNSSLCLPSRKRRHRLASPRLALPLPTTRPPTSRMGLDCSTRSSTLAVPLKGTAGEPADSSPPTDSRRWWWPDGVPGPPAPAPAPAPAPPMDPAGAQTHGQCRVGWQHSSTKPHCAHAHVRAQAHGTVTRGHGHTTGRGGRGGAQDPRGKTSSSPKHTHAPSEEKPLEDVRPRCFGRDAWWLHSTRR